MSKKGNKLIETFIVTFFGTIGSLVATLIDKSNFIIIAFISGLSAIIGLLIYEYFLQLKDYGSDTNKSKKFTPLIATILVLGSCILFRKNLYASLPKVGIIHSLSYEFGSWVMSLVIFGAVSCVSLASIHHLKVYGFGETIGDKIEFIFSRLFFVFGLGLLIIVATYILILIIFLFFWLLSYLGFNYFNTQSQSSYFDSLPLLSVLIISELYVIHQMNIMGFEEG